MLDAVTSDGSTILAAPQKTRARAPTGKRLPTIRSRAERAEERRYINLTSLSLSPLSLKPWLPDALISGATWARGTNSSEQLRQASIPRAERQIVPEAFKVAQVGACLTFSL